MFENIGTNAVIVNVCALSSGVLIGFVIKKFFAEENKREENPHKNSSEEEV